jgi:hypothetical protein
MGPWFALIPGWVKRAVVALVGGFAILWGFAEYNQRLGKTELLADSKQEGKKNAEKANAHHDQSRKPGAAQRVLKDYCRDC